MSTHQHKTLAVETSVERETRLQRYRSRYREQSAQLQLPLFRQCSVKTKMRMQAWLHWARQYVLHAQRDSLASGFTPTQLNVCIVVVTHIFRMYIPLPKT